MSPQRMGETGKEYSFGFGFEFPREWIGFTFHSSSGQRG